MHYSLMFTVLKVFTLVLATAAGNNCTWTSTSGHAFDLSQLRRGWGEADWSIALSGGSKSSLLLNMCGTIGRAAPVQCTNNAGGAVGLQMSGDGAMCWAVSSARRAPTWSLIDDARPTKGAVLRYTGGERCGDEATGRPRSLTLHMLCAANFEPQDAPAYAYESPRCSYHVVWPTLSACPAPPANMWQTLAMLSLAIGAVVAVALALFCGARLALLRGGELESAATRRAAAARQSWADFAKQFPTTTAFARRGDGDAAAMTV